MAVFALVFLAPIAYSIYLSLFRTQMVGGTQFVGLENYARAFSDPQFWSGVSRVGLFLVVQVPIMLGIALLVALAIDSGRLYGRNFFRISIFLPYAVPAVVATLMWGFMYGTRFGLVANINDALGTSIANPLSPDWVLLSIGNIVTWEFVGYNMLIFYSALRVVPTSLYEAAELDGASQWQVVRAIKIPAIRGSPRAPPRTSRRGSAATASSPCSRACSTTRACAASCPPPSAATSSLAVRTDGTDDFWFLVNRTARPVEVPDVAGDVLAGRRLAPSGTAAAPGEGAILLEPRGVAVVRRPAEPTPPR